MDRTLPLLLAICALGFSGCGVKAPPIAPERPGETREPRLDCSPKDPECDKTDPKYKPLGT